MRPKEIGGTWMGEVSPIIPRKNGFCPHLPTIVPSCFVLVPSTHPEKSNFVNYRSISEDL